MKNNKCVYYKSEATFDYQNKTENCFDGLPLNEKGNHSLKFRSFKGIWKKDKMGICTKFGEPDIQFDKRGGFFYCDENRARECDFYRERKGGK